MSELCVTGDWLFFLMYDDASILLQKVSLCYLPNQATYHRDRQTDRDNRDTLLREETETRQKRQTYKTKKKKTKKIHKTKKRQRRQTHRWDRE